MIDQLIAIHVCCNSIKAKPSLLSLGYVNEAFFYTIDDSQKESRILNHKSLQSFFFGGGEQEKQCCAI